MATLGELAGRFCGEERAAGNLLDDPGVLAQLVAATRFYSGYAAIRSLIDEPAPQDVTEATALTDSEWALIRPLFLLYVERETAIQVEASRGMGVDPFGRSVSEVGSEILQVEADLPRKAFFQPIITV